MLTVTHTTTDVSLARWARGVKRSQLQEMLFAAAKPGIISFALGLPDPELFPVEGDRKKPGELCGSRTFFGIAAKSRIPLVELVSEFFIQHSRPYLQEQMGAATTPTHLLLFDESLA
jgi:hypothetical protein